MDFTPVLAFLQTLAPWVHTVLVVLGAIVTLGTAVDSLIPDSKDGGFMTKLMAIPVLGPFLAALTRFSPFNVKQP